MSKNKRQFCSIFRRILTYNVTRKGFPVVWPVWVRVSAFLARRMKVKLGVTLFMCWLENTFLTDFVSIRPQYTRLDGLIVNLGGRIFLNIFRGVCGPQDLWGLYSESALFLFTVVWPVHGFPFFFFSFFRFHFFFFCSVSIKIAASGLFSVEIAKKKSHFKSFLALF